MKEHSLFISLCLFLSFTLPAQRMIFKRDSVSFTPQEKQWGRNAPNMLIPYVQFNWALGPKQDGARLYLGHSFNFRLGLDYKRKITSWLSLGLKMQYATETFRLVQDFAKILPDTILHESEWFNLQCLTVGGFLRFNLGLQREGSYGIYLETGVNYVWAIRFFHIYNEELTGGESEQVRIHNLTYTQPGYGEAYLKLGWRHFATISTFRFTPLFKSQSGYPDLPWAKLGFELAF